MKNLHAQPAWLGFSHLLGNIDISYIYIYSNI